MKGMRLLWVLVLAMAVLAALSAPAMAAGPGDGAVLGGEFVLESGDTYEDDLVILGGSAHLKPESVVDGDVAVMAGQLVVDGRVMGDIVAFGGAVRLGETARVDGDVIALGSLERHPDARVDGHVVEGADAPRDRQWLSKLVEGLPALVAPERPSPEVGSPPVPRETVSGLARAARRVGTAVTLLFVALIVMSLLPTHMERITDFMGQSVVLSLVVGLLTLVISAVLVPLLVIICIGFPVAVVLALGLLLGALVGWVAAGRFVARRLRIWLKLGEQTPMVEALIGVLLITAVAMVPCGGTLLAFLTVSWGLGAVVLTRLGTTEGSEWATIGGAPTADGPGVAAASGGASQARDTRRLAGSSLGDALPDEK